MVMDLKAVCARYFLLSNCKYSSVSWFLAVFNIAFTRERCMFSNVKYKRNITSLFARHKALR